MVRLPNAQALDRAYFTKRMFARAVLPAPLAALGLALAEMGDAIIIGHGLGMEGLAAAGFLHPLFLIGSFLAFGLSMGGAIVFGNLVSEGKKDQALGIFNFFVQISVLIGFLFAAGCLIFEEPLLGFLGTDPEDGAVYDMARSYLFFIILGIPFEILTEVITAYMRNDNAETLSTVVLTACGLVNLVISGVLLLVCGWGIEACSLGFLLSNGAAFLVCVLYLLRGKGVVRFAMARASWREAIVPLRLGFSTSLEYIFESVFALLAIHALADMAGAMGVAVFNLVENVALLFIFLFEMIGKMGQPLFSTFFAEKNFTELGRIFRYCLIYTVAVGLIAAVVVVMFPQLIDLLFGLDDIEDVSMAYYAVQVFCIGSVFSGVAILLQNFFQSKEDERSTFLIVFLRRLGVIVPLVFLLAQFGFYVFWFVYPLSELITLALLWLYQRIYGGRQDFDAGRVYEAAFLYTPSALPEQMNGVEEFAKKWGATDKQKNLLLLSVEEIGGIVALHAKRRKGVEANAPIHIQMTVIAREDGAFDLHYRDDANEFNPFEFLADSHKPLALRLYTAELRVLKKHALNLLYRNNQGFNTIAITVGA